MVTTLTKRGYVELGFPDVDLRDSIVLGWNMAGSTLKIRLEVSVGSEHPSYTPTSAGARSCFVSGALYFESVSAIVGFVPQKDIAPNVDPDGYRDYETLHGIWKKGDGDYYIEGEFGEVYLTSDAPSLEIDGSWISINS